MKEILFIIFCAVLIIMLPFIKLFKRIFSKPYKGYMRSIPSPPKNLRDRYNEKYANPSLSKYKNSSYWEAREKTRTENPNDLMDAITIGLMMNDNTEEIIKLTADDNNRILDSLGFDKGFDGGFGGGGFSGSGASASWSDDNSSLSSLYDSGSSSSDSSSYDSSSSSSDY